MTNTSPVALVHGAGCSFGAELAAQLVGQNTRIVLYDEPPREHHVQATAASLGLASDLLQVLPGTVSNLEVVQKASAVYGRLDFLFNCVTPDEHTSPDDIFSYPQHLLTRNVAAAEAMIACQAHGAIVNQWFTGSLFAGTPLEAPILLSKGAITGLTRQVCVRFGKAGIRVNAIQAGLVTLPETKGLVTTETLSRKPPVGRWGKPVEIAKFMLFLALRNGYMTGQTICLDGGLTAGNTGT